MGERTTFESRSDVERAGALGALYAPDFYLESPQPWFSFEHSAVMSAVDLAKWIESGVHDLASSHRFAWREPERARFAVAFARIQEAISTGRIEKAVPVAFAQASASFDVGDRARTLLNALRTPLPLRAYGIWNAEQGAIGASPETLFRQLDAFAVETVALAGTHRKPATDEAIRDFLKNPKERAEHQFVVDDIRRALGARGEVDVGPTHVADLPTLLHLRSLVRARLSVAAEFEDLARALHPTPALGVAPREAGLSILREADAIAGCERGRFGAPFGLWMTEPFASDCLVAIRCVRWTRAGSEIGSGCGVVAASLLESEWQELQAKRDSVRKALGLEDDSQPDADLAVRASEGASL